MAEYDLGSLILSVSQLEKGSEEYARRNGANGGNRKPIKVFSYKKGNIYVLGREVNEETLEDISKVRLSHIVPSKSERHLLESLIWVLANQRINYERTVAFLHQLHGIKLEMLRDPEIVYKIAHETELRWFDTNRFESALNYVEQNGGVKEVAENYLENPHEFRKELVSKVKWMGMKIASMWYQAIGGEKDILCLDVHHLREAANMGVEEVPRTSYIGHERRKGMTAGRFELRSINKRKYEEIESKLVELITSSRTAKKYPEFFFNEDGILNGLFTSALLWGMSAQAYRRE